MFAWFGHASHGYIRATKQTQAFVLERCEILIPNLATQNLHPISDLSIQNLIASELAQLEIYGEALAWSKLKGPDKEAPAVKASDPNSAGSNAFPKATSTFVRSL